MFFSGFPTQPGKNNGPLFRCCVVVMKTSRRWAQPFLVRQGWCSKAWMLLENTAEWLCCLTFHLIIAFLFLRCLLVAIPGGCLNHREVPFPFPVCFPFPSFFFEPFHVTWIFIRNCMILNTRVLPVGKRQMHNLNKGIWMIKQNGIVISNNEPTIPYIYTRVIVSEKKRKEWPHVAGTRVLRLFISQF